MRGICMAGIAGIVLSASSVVMAGPQATAVGYAWGNTSPGGPFTFQANTGAGNLAPMISGLGTLGQGANQWLTFCLEHNEFISFGTTYNVTIDTVALLGGNGNATPGTGYSSPGPLSNGGGGDALDPRTAYLYSSFMAGTLDALLAATSYSGDKTFTYGATDSGKALQNAIWFLENEILSVTADTLAGNLVRLANNSNWTDLGNVRVLNLWDKNNNSPQQSQLVIIPLPGSAGMAAAGLASVLGFGFLRRRR